MDPGSGFGSGSATLLLYVKISLKGLREAELEDWKDGRKTRVMAVDSGMLAYTDFTHGDWPVVLVTWPPR